MPKIEIGSTAYLHRGPEAFSASETHLLISSHGLWLPTSFSVPAWANLHFYGKEYAAINDPGVYNIMKGESQVVESVLGTQSTTNYLLSKFQGSHGSEDETYDSLQSDVKRNSDWVRKLNEDLDSGDAARTARAAGMSTDRNYTFRFDVCTIRNRGKIAKIGGGISLKTLLSNLAKNGFEYSQIHCSFCRWRPLGGSVDAQKFGS